MRAKITGKSALEQQLAMQIALHKLPEPFREHRFHPVRMWRFDFAWPMERRQNVAVEVQGGIWTGGRHSTGAGMEKDYEKLNAAQLLGWIVLLVSPGHVRSGKAIEWIRDALK